MPFFSLPRMVEANKRFHVPTEIVPGAETRGSSSFNPGCEVGHHTAGAKTGDRPSLHLCIVGRSDLDGPLCNDFLTRAGVAVIVACGRANHAGLGSFRGIIGNSGAWGIEAEDDGDGTWSDLQIVSYPRLVAARLWLINRDASWYVPHRVWGANPIGGGWAGRKIDPKGIADEWMRAHVDALLKNPNHVPTRAIPGSKEIVMLDAADKTWITGELKRVGLRVAATALSGGANTVVSAADAKGFEGISLAHAVYMLMYGDDANDTTDKQTHPNNMQRIRAELALSAAREAGMLAAMQQLAQSSGVSVTPDVLREMIEAAAKKAIAGIDLKLVADVATTN